METRLEKEIERVENDEYMTQSEKNREIRELERDYRSAAREAAQEAYDDEMERW